MSGDLTEEEQAEYFTSYENLVETIDQDTENTGVMMFYGDVSSKNKS